MLFRSLESVKTYYKTIAERSLDNQKEMEIKEFIKEKWLKFEKNPKIKVFISLLSEIDYSHILCSYFAYYLLQGQLFGYTLNKKQIQCASKWLSYGSNYFKQYINKLNTSQSCKEDKNTSKNDPLTPNLLHDIGNYDLRENSPERYTSYTKIEQKYQPIKNLGELKLKVGENLTFQALGTSNMEGAILLSVIDEQEQKIDCSSLVNKGKFQFKAFHQSSSTIYFRDINID